MVNAHSAEIPAGAYEIGCFAGKFLSSAINAKVKWNTDTKALPFMVLIIETLIKQK